MSGIYNLPPTHQLSQALQRRTNQLLQSYTDDEVFMYLADTLYKERKRLEDDQTATMEYRKALQTASRAIHRNRGAIISALMNLVNAYTHEIHNHFSPRTYKIAAKVLPNALTRLLTAAQPAQLFGADFDPKSRIIVQGPVDKLQKLSKSHVLVYVPTHLSNLDSPLIGYALAAAELPPVIYGAGLNLFSNPLMSFFMSRLGAYTVDRRKQNRLYKNVLKDYAIEATMRQCHSLFFPGGTRSRSGKIESKLKKGLLGTPIHAWQETIANGKNLEVLFVPCTLSFSLTLEAETLITDSLAEKGKSRFIITDDEFSETKTLANFGRKVLNLDSSVYVRFGDPLDIAGNSVTAQGESIDPTGNTINRREYVTDRHGAVVFDKQRDQVYTEILAQKITASYKKDNIALATHLAAFSAWQLLSEKHPRLDDIQKVALQPQERRIKTTDLVSRIDKIHQQIIRAKSQGRICEELPKDAQAILQSALLRFGSFHRSRCLMIRGEHVEVGSKLALYYGNRLQGYGFTGTEKT